MSALSEKDIVCDAAFLSSVYNPFSSKMKKFAHRKNKKEKSWRAMSKAKAEGQRLKAEGLKAEG